MRTLRTIGSQREFIQMLDHFLCNDTLEDVECALYMPKKRSITQEEAKGMYKMLSKIFRMSHAMSGSCPNNHLDWYQEANDFIRGSKTDL